jgi:hypothetical protein
MPPPPLKSWPISAHTGGLGRATDFEKKKEKEKKKWGLNKKTWFLLRSRHIF